MNSEKDFSIREASYFTGDSYHIRHSDNYIKNNRPSANSNEEDEPYDGLLKLFVGGLNYLSLQGDIKSYFETFGKVASCTLLIDRSTGKSRGFAFVSIEDPSGELKEKVLSRKHEINGKIVDVKLAVEGKKREEMLDSSKKIFVGGLDPTVTNDDLRYFFSNYGDVREAVVLFDNNRGASRCFGFVTFDSKDTVDLLVKDNNYAIKGKLVDVKQALPKSLQKAQTITCQSGVDIILNRHKTNRKAKGAQHENMMDFDAQENNDIDDRNFVDMVTNPFYNSKDYYQRFAEIENSKMNTDPLHYNFMGYETNLQTDKKYQKKK